jgi:Tfp pilus assembly protein PilO
MLVTRIFAYLPKRLPYRFFSTIKYRIGIGLIVFVSIVSVSFVFLIYPQKQNLAQLVSETASLENTIRTKHNTAIQQQKLLQLRHRLHQVLSDFYITEPEYLITTRLITQIEQWSKQQDLQLKKIIWGQLKQQEELTIQPVNLNFTGTYHQLMSLFQYLGERFAVIDIVGFTMQKKMVPISSHILLELQLHIVILKKSK